MAPQVNRGAFFICPIQEVEFYWFYWTYSSYMHGAGCPPAFVGAIMEFDNNTQKTLPAKGEPMMQNQQYRSIRNILQAAEEKLKEHPKIFQIFQNCYANTLETTVKTMQDGTAYVITGDIPAMWLRDSAAQLRPYLPAAKGEPALEELFIGLSRRQFQYIHIDPYANAFNEAENGHCWERDLTEQGGWVWERKYEVDSLCYPLQLAYLIWKNIGRTDHFDASFQAGARDILRVFRTEQNHEEMSPYRFIRQNTYFTDTLSREGKGALVKSGIGLTWSGFRPSDDACTYGYLIPSNMFAAVALGYLEEIAGLVLRDKELQKEAAHLKEMICEGIETYGITRTEEFGEVYAYEVDGFGQFNLMDDANVPSLLSMEYLGYHGRKKEVAANTRKMILSAANPYYFSGSKGAGIGSSHTPSSHIWPIALAMEGLTEKTLEKKLEALSLLARTDGGTGLMHESFDVNDDRKFTRAWFSWANAMFSELALEYCGFPIVR